MSQKRMFDKNIIDSDLFLDMPQSSQCLYFHLNMRADDEGFISNPKRIMKMLGSSEDDLIILVAKSFVLKFESGVIVIKHWHLNNYLNQNRIKKTLNVNEKTQIELDDNNEYNFNNSSETLISSSLTNVKPRLNQNSIEENSIEENSIEENSIEDTLSYDNDIIVSENQKFDKKSYKEMELQIFITESVKILNSILGTNYEDTTPTTVKNLKAIYNKGKRKEDVMLVVEYKNREWKNTDWKKYLRPSTLFGNKFIEYLENAKSEYDTKYNQASAIVDWAEREEEND